MLNWVIDANFIRYEFSACFLLINIYLPCFALIHLLRFYFVLCVFHLDLSFLPFFLTPSFSYRASLFICQILFLHFFVCVCSLFCFFDLLPYICPTCLSLSISTNSGYYGGGVVVRISRVWHFRTRTQHVPEAGVWRQHASTVTWNVFYNSLHVL